MINKFLTAIFWAVLATGLVPHAVAAATNFSGTWVGSWFSSVFGDRGDLEVRISQSGSALTGELIAPNATDCGGSLDFPLEGTLSGDGNTAIFTNNEFTDPCLPTEPQRLSLTATRSGDYLSGDFTAEYFENDSWIIGDSGTFSLNRICCTITASAGTGGSMDPSGKLELAPESSITFTITADKGFTVDDVIVDGGSKGALPGYTFNNITADHIISATFAESKKLMPFLQLLLDEE